MTTRAIPYQYRQTSPFPFYFVSGDAYILWRQVPPTDVILIIFRTRRISALVADGVA